MKLSIKLKSPLTHGEFSQAQSNVLALRRFPVLVDGEITHVPAVSGNALRGKLRRIVMRHFLECIDFRRDEPTWDKAYGICANGGILTSYDTTVDPERIAQVREALPPLSVFGAAMYSWFLPGRMSIGICWPVCDLTVKLGAVKAPGRDVPRMVDIEGEVQHSRLPDRDRANPDDSKPMPHGVEVFNTGVELQSDIIFENETTDVEKAVLGRAARTVSTLGGMISSGLGRIETDCDLDDESYAGWLADDGNRKRAAEMLRELCK